MPIHETPWYRTESGDGRPALRNSAGIVCWFWRPIRFDGQNERYQRELAEVEGTIALVQSAPALRAALEIIAAGNTDPDDMVRIAAEAIANTQSTTNETTTR